MAQLQSSQRKSRSLHSGIYAKKNMQQRLPSSPRQLGGNNNRKMHTRRVGNGSKLAAIKLKPGWRLGEPIWPTLVEAAMAAEKGPGRWRVEL